MEPADHPIDGSIQLLNSIPCSPVRKGRLGLSPGSRERFLKMGRPLSYVLCIAVLGAAVGTALSPQCSATDDTERQCWRDISRLSSRSVQSVCADPSIDSRVKQALRTVCLQDSVAGHSPGNQRAIVIGFLGGFVRRDDSSHPEVWFAKYLREHYGSAIDAVVFSNHQADAALHTLLSLLDTDCDGTVTDLEKSNARIILYGHSWGASETAAFARKLGKLGIPVFLTIQIDIVGKPGQNPREVPLNVREAVNFFQTTGGLLRGQPRIVAADPGKTKIIGNFRMSYKNHSIDCGNFPWFARTFNRPHHEIENDPRIWEQVNSLIETDLGLDTQDAYWADLDAPKQATSTDHAKPTASAQGTKDVARDD